MINGNDELYNALQVVAEAYAEDLSVFGALLPIGWAFRSADHKDAKAAVESDGYGKVSDWLGYYVIEMHYYIPGFGELYQRAFVDFGELSYIEAMDEFIRIVRAGEHEKLLQETVH